MGTPSTHARTHTHTCMYTHKSKARRRTHSSDNLPHTQPQALDWASGQRKEGKVHFLPECKGLTSEEVEAQAGEALPSPILAWTSFPAQTAARRGLHSSTTTWAPGSRMSPQVSEPPSHLSIKHQAPCLAHSRCSMKGKFLPPTPPSTWACNLDPASITFSPCNKWALGHCRLVGGSDLPLMPIEPSDAHPGTLRQHSGWRQHLPLRAFPLPNPAPPPMTISQAGTQTEVLQGRSLF